MAYRPKGFYWVDSNTSRGFHYEGASIAHWDGKEWTVCGVEQRISVREVIAPIPADAVPSRVKRRRMNAVYASLEVPNPEKYTINVDLLRRLASRERY